MCLLCFHVSMISRMRNHICPALCFQILEAHWWSNYNDVIHKLFLLICWPIFDLQTFAAGYICTCSCGTRCVNRELSETTRNVKHVDNVGLCIKHTRNFILILSLSLSLCLSGERLPRIWTKLRGNYSYKPPGVSYTAQGPHKQPEILKKQFFIFSSNTRILIFWTWISVSRLWSRL